MSTIGKFASDTVLLEAAEERSLGECRPDGSATLRFTLHVTGPDSAIVRRHRQSAPHFDPAAAIVHEHGQVVDFEWDEWHLEHRKGNEAWMVLVERWAATKIAADWANPAGLTA